MSQSPFQKFIAPKKNSKIKEEFRQEKKKAKKERAAYFDKVKEEKYQARIAAKKKAFSAPDKVVEKSTTQTKSPSTAKSGGFKPTINQASEEVMPLNKYLA